MEASNGLAADHVHACGDFTAVVRQVPADRWTAPTPCTEWDARALVEHVIGFHEFLLLRPLGVRAHRPRAGSTARWLATERAIGAALRHPGLGEPVPHFDGDERRPVDVLRAITGDVLIHTWDLARSAGVSYRLDDGWCAAALAAGPVGEHGSEGSSLFAPPVPVRSDASAPDRFLASRGRDPHWRPPPGGATYEAVERPRPA
ncbi:MAG TPA: TIGR03086 family metal-binding protein [Acidimicrobiia bacterium]|nr:TIGR03086 family metal-binding protein [Acidimicrobiia bacterium]